ncbi:unnamed protein product [Caenorhabditis auriculariae]|uniref:Saposin B-type domain-containing protein n=1 Tax=Caenorhabditis auriculariae TaxID=2777116 RepID=A0A8S1GZ47_9PELO|nr:unnamed protein product [Caenorhabditis auriculariae]
MSHGNNSSAVFVLLGFLLFVNSCYGFEPVGQLPQTCSEDEIAQKACQCCKQDCWYGVVEFATNLLQHMPGEGGQQESLDTLRLTRKCIVSECAEHCPNIFKSK